MCGLISSRVTSTSFPLSSVRISLNPVAFCPGRDRLSTNPTATGSPTLRNTIGMVEVMKRIGGASLRSASSACDYKNSTPRYCRDCCAAGFRPGECPPRGGLPTYALTAVPIKGGPIGVRQSSSQAQGLHPKRTTSLGLICAGKCSVWSTLP
jgi:hypothetical protein